MNLINKVEKFIINHIPLLNQNNFIMVKKTVVQKILDDIKEIESKGLTLTSKGIVLLLEDKLKEEERQIKEAFEEGMKYGKSELQTIDYPASRYYNGTYKK